MPSEWEWSDAWVAKAASAVDPNDDDFLVAVIANADHLNHAVLSFAEFDQAIRRLLGSGLAEVEDGRVVLTPEGRKATAPGAGGLFSQVDVVLKRLRAVQMREADWHADAGEFGGAVDTYVAGRWN